MDSPAGRRLHGACLLSHLPSWFENLEMTVGDRIHADPSAWSDWRIGHKVHDLWSLNEVSGVGIKNVEINERTGILGEIVSTLDPFAAKYQEKERSGKRKPQVAGDANLSIVLR